LRTYSVASLAFFLIAAGCSTPDPKYTQAGYPGGFETEIHTVVELKAPPKETDQTVLLTSVDSAVTECLEKNGDKIVANAIERYDQERLPEGTKITPAEAKLQLEDYRIQAEDQAGTNPEFSGKVTRFRFTLRRAKARILPEPMRVEALVFCVERSWAPGDTLRFPQILRKEVMDELTDTVVQLTKAQGFDPVVRTDKNAQH